jgi:uncharacterized protein YkwD
MKKFICVLMVMTLFASAFVYADTSDENTSEIRVLIDNVAVEFYVPPQIVSGRTLVPMRAIFEALGATVDWDSATQTVTALTRWEQTVILTVGSTEISVDGSLSQMDIAPIIQNGRTLVPARFVAQALGYEVHWDSINSNVLINTNPFIRLNPQPVTLTDETISLRDLGSWIIHYLDSGGISDLEREVVRITNVKREQHGVAPLVICEVLSAAARFKSQEMYDLEYFGHESPVYGNAVNIPRLLFGAYHFTGENILFNGTLLIREMIHGNDIVGLAEKIVNDFYTSPGHRENMLHNGHNVMGVGVVVSEWGVIATQMFGSLPHGQTATPIMERYIEVYTDLYGNQ